MLRGPRILPTPVRSAPLRSRRRPSPTQRTARLVTMAVAAPRMTNAAAAAVRVPSLRDAWSVVSVMPTATETRTIRVDTALVHLLVRTSCPGPTALLVTMATSATVPILVPVEPADTREVPATRLKPAIHSRPSASQSQASRLATRSFRRVEAPVRVFTTSTRRETARP